MAMVGLHIEAENWSRDDNDESTGKKCGLRHLLNISSHALVGLNCCRRADGVLGYRVSQTSCEINFGHQPSLLFFLFMTE